MNRETLFQKVSQGATRRSVGLLLLGFGLLVRPTMAEATPVSFTVNTAASFVALTANGALQAQASLTTPTLTFDINFAAGGNSKPFTLTGLTLPSMMNSTDTYAFTGLPASIGGTINVVTGAISTNAITGNIVRTPPGGAGGTASLGSSLTLTTGTIGAISCGGSFPAVTGSPVSSGSGAATMLGTDCVGADPGIDGPWLIRLKIVGTFSPNPIPEPGTAALLASGLSGIAWAGRRRRNTV